jgi:hypothetical protein
LTIFPLDLTFSGPHSPPAGFAGTRFNRWNELLHWEAQHLITRVTQEIAQRLRDEPASSVWIRDADAAGFRV